MSASAALDTPAVRPHHMHYGPHPLAMLIFCAVTGGDVNQWVHFQRNMRILRMAAYIAVIVAVVVAKELIQDWAADSVSGHG